MTENPSLEDTRPIDGSGDGTRTRAAPTEIEPWRGARLGSLVEVVDRAGRATRYELVARAPGPSPVAATPASPTGRALWGARPGDAVRVTLPNGRQRRVRVTSVTPVRPCVRADGGGSAP